MLGFFDTSPYVLYGNWGYEHQKSCKNATKPDEDALDTNTGKCTDCASCTADSLKLKDTLNPDAAGDAVTLNNNADVSNKFTSNAAITITAKSKTVNFTALSEVTISITKGTIKNKDNNLQTESPKLSQNTVLKLEASGTLSGGNQGASVKLAGTIVVTSTGSHNIGQKLNFGGGPSNGNVSGTLNLANGAGNIGKTHVTIQSGNLTINSGALDTLKGATGTLGIGTSSPDTSVTYNLITPNTIILGLSTLSGLTSGADGSKVILKGLPTSQINIAPQGTTGIRAESAYGTVVSFSTTDRNFTSLKSGGATLTLAQEFTGATITKTGEGAAPQPLKIGDSLDPGNELNISGTNIGTTVTITNIIVTSDRQSLGSTTNYNLTGGIEGTLSLTDSADRGTVQGTLTITKISYDPNEFHDNHTTNGLCCYFGKFNLWKEYEYDSNWDGKPETTVYGYIWYFIDILIVIKITLAVIFIYSLHYRDSSISSAIINQPKMSNALTIVSYFICIMKVIEVIFNLSD